eukprot:TRINITY_DN2045_c1_g1_i4.p1 TRINITY_DN2045_c1_g1~~TRINITY_DN2045_c1_g1_i4.p1  ORF type:complete len:100 (+),score=12.80 TRINITY_DN2045_c1_g1_i4:195-494(+)
MSELTREQHTVNELSNSVHSLDSKSLFIKTLASSNAAGTPNNERLQAAIDDMKYFLSSTLKVVLSFGVTDFIVNTQDQVKFIQAMHEILVVHSQFSDVM